MSNPALNIAETIQTASIKRHPSPRHDLNPSTAASNKQPVSLSSPTPSSDNASIPSSALDAPNTITPRPRHATLPPLPDLRFEQSYLASLQGAETYSRIAYITIRDQVFLPLIQGTLWTLALSGWRYWNRGAKFSGASVGSKVRRWWWRVNNWEIPRDGRLESEKFAGEVREYYVGQFSNPSGD